MQDYLYDLLRSTFQQLVGNIVRIQFGVTDESIVMLFVVVQINGKTLPD